MADTTVAASVQQAIVPSGHHRVVDAHVHFWAWSEEERAAFYAGNAERFYRLGEPQPAAASR